MAAEIHDTLGQGLTGIITQLQAARRREPRTGSGTWTSRSGWRATSLAEARRSVHAVGPGHLAAAPLDEALRAVVTEWGERNEVTAEFTVTGTVRPMHPEIEETLLRTAQEALANAAKHAGASRVGLTLSYMEDVTTLDVRDDGAGFDPERARDGGGFGLTSMRRRVDRLAGTLEIESAPGAGTVDLGECPGGDTWLTRRSGCSSSTTIPSSGVASAGCSTATRSSRYSARPPTARRPWTLPRAGPGRDPHGPADARNGWGHRDHAPLEAVLAGLGGVGGGSGAVHACRDDPSGVRQLLPGQFR